MSETELKNPPEIEKLLVKYRGGTVPPLATRDNGKYDGLIGEELLEIFRKGFSATYAIPLYVFLVPESYKDANVREDDRSEDPFSHILKTSENLSHHRLDDLSVSCKYFPSLEKNNANAQMKREKDADREVRDTENPDPELSFGLRLCENCPAKQWLVPLYENGGTGACLCRTGIVSLYVPVYVAGDMVAILSTKCQKSEAGAVWPVGIDEHNAGSPDVDKALIAARTDIRQKVRNKTQKCEEALELGYSKLLSKLTERVKADPKFEIYLDDLENMVIGLENAGKYLSDLAGKTYRLEKESVINWLRAEMASALSSDDGFWDKIKWCFENLAQLLGVDYILLISRDRSHLDSLNLLCQYGLPEESLPVLRYNWAGSKAHVDDFVKLVSTFKDIQEIDLRQYRNLPVLGMLYGLYGKGINYPVLIAGASNMNGRLTFMVLGKKGSHAAVEDRDDLNIAGHSAQKWLKEDDQQYLITIGQELAIIMNVFFSMRKFQETMEAQTNLMESVAHDLRTPIQNIMIAAENLRECRIAPERASRTITGVVTQLQRLNLLAQKAWMLERIRLDKMVYNDEQTVHPFLIFTECRELLVDMAERASIDILIDPVIQNWRAIQADTEIFRLVVLNLLHNAIKYSFPNTSVRISGWQDSVSMDLAMTFENEGIVIQNEEKDRIFERYFRSKNAIKMEPTGSGVGLALVKEFIDHYEGMIDVRSTEIGFGRYLNVFSLFLPGI